MLPKFYSIDESQLILSRTHPDGSKYFISNKEIKCTIDILYNQFGSDKNGLNNYINGEIDSENIIIRQWEFESVKIDFIRLDGHFQLYFLFYNTNHHGIN